MYVEEAFNSKSNSFSCGVSLRSLFEGWGERSYPEGGGEFSWSIGDDSEVELSVVAKRVEIGGVFLITPTKSAMIQILGKMLADENEAVKAYSEIEDALRSVKLGYDADIIMKIKQDKLRHVFHLRFVLGRLEK